MESPPDLPESLAATRGMLHRVAAHVLGRRRYEVSGRFGLRASPGGLATPAFGDGPEVVRVAGGVLIREIAGAAGYLTMSGSTLRDLADFAGTDITTEFSVGADSPEVGDVDQPLTVDGEAMRVIADWYGFGWLCLDRVLLTLPTNAEPAVIQLWPEHFDVGTNVRVAFRSLVNLGASPGDDYSGQPYLYVGPWGPERPGDPEFWNAPFGAALSWAELRGLPDPIEVGVRFLRTGLRHAAAPGNP